MLEIWEYTTYVSPSGDVFKFDAPYTYWLLSTEGTGMPPVQYITERGPFQHGESVRDVFLRPRVIQLLIRQQFDSRDAYYAGRHDLLTILKPSRLPGTLHKVLSNGAKRSIEVYVDSGPGFRPTQQDQWDEWSIHEVIRFIAYNPVFFDPTQRTQNFLATEPLSDEQLVFPITFPIRFGPDSTDPNLPSLTVTYQGNWIEYPTIELVGPMVNPTIHNLTTDEKITLNYSIQPGRIVTIKLTYGTKTVTLDDGTNLIGYVSLDSDLGSFHLEPGVNQFAIVVHGTNAASRITLKWYDRYIGY